MATLTGKTIADTYKDLLQVSNANSGIDGTLRTVQDGEGTNSALQLSNSTVNINGTFQLNGGTLTATASALNAVTDLSGVTGLVAMTGGSPIGRSIAVGTGLSVTNADGTAGNPTIQLDSTPVVSGSYGPVVKFDVNQKGQIVSASTPVSVSIATVRTSELVASILHVTSDVSVNGNVVVSGGLEVISDVSANAVYATSINSDVIDANVINVSVLNYSLVSTTSFTVNNLTVVSKVSGNNATFSGTVSASSFYGDGSNLTNLPTAPVSVSAYTVNVLTVVSAATINGIVSAANFVGGGAGLTNVSAVFAASATNATNAVSAVFATSATNATNAVSATFATSATDALNATNATSAVFASSATNATNAVNATNVTGSGIVSAASAVFTGIVSANEIDASIANFNGAVSVGSSLNVVGTISGTNAVFTGSVSVSSAIAVGAGTVGAPSLTTTGDPNTGIWFPAADTLAASTGGSERMRIDSSGNVGIGTSSPTTRLHVVASAAAGSHKLDADGGAYAYLQSDGAAGTELRGYVAGVQYSNIRTRSDSMTINNIGNTALLFNTNNTERMRIDSSGNVGIGTSSPAAKLDVSGSFRTTLNTQTRPSSSGQGGLEINWNFSGGGAEVNFWNIYDNAPNSFFFRQKTGANTHSDVYLAGTSSHIFYISNSERMRIDSSGNVGIGTSLPGAKLHVASGAILIDNTQKIQGKDSSGTIRDIITPWSDNIVYIDGYASGIQIRTNYQATNAIKIDGSGNVGIGTTGPTRALDVVGTASFTGVVSVSSVAFGTSNLGKKIAVSGAAIATIVSLTDATSISVDFNTSQNFAVMLTGNRTLESPSNCVAGQTGSIFVMQNVSGGKTLSFGSNWKFAAGTAPTLTTTASAVDRLDYIVFSSTAIHTVATLDVR